MMRTLITLLLLNIAFAVQLGNVKIGKVSFQYVEPPSPPAESIGAEWYENNIIGGWWGYPDTVNRAMADDTVYTWAELLSAYSAASAGDIIYLMDTCEFNATGSEPLWNGDDGIIIASGRGTRWGDTVSHGALIYKEHNIAQAEYCFKLQSDIQFTGIRFRGPISEIEGEISTGDTLKTYTTSYKSNAIYTEWDDVDIEVDNCEFWGWGWSSIKIFNGRTYVYNCYFHDGCRLYTGYGITASNEADDVTTFLILEANYFDKHDIMPSGATFCDDLYDTICYNIFSPIMEPRDPTVWMHGDLQDPRYIGTTVMYNNTFQRADDGDYIKVSNFAGSSDAVPKDSIRMHHNWFWDYSQSEAMSTYGKMVINDNYYSAGDEDDIPDGLLARIPSAVIWSSVDSCTVGTAAATVKFHGNGSSDPDGDVTQYYWWFGDSMDTDNFTRKTKLNVDAETDTVTHTFGEIGKYTVRLTVVDDYGYRDYAYKTINVKPASDSLFLSFWSMDQYVQEHKNVWERQCWLVDGNDSIELWSQDIAGDGSWEHIIVNVDSVIDDWASDSVTIKFKSVCLGDSSGLGDVEIQHDVVWDDIVFYGGNVVNGDFETGYPCFRNWGGQTNPPKRNDGYWYSDFDLTGDGSLCSNHSQSHVHAGSCGFYFRVHPDPCYKDDYVVLWQRVDILGQ